MAGTFKLTMTAVMAVMICGAQAGLARADSFGAISISPEGATGWSYGFSSRGAAEEEAQQNCYNNADECNVAIWFKNACGAVARGPDGWGSGWGATRRRAQREAVASCSRHSEDCEVIRWQCSGAD